MFCICNIVIEVMSGMYPFQLYLVAALNSKQFREISTVKVSVLNISYHCVLVNFRSSANTVIHVQAVRHKIILRLTSEEPSSDVLVKLRSVSAVVVAILSCICTPSSVFYTSLPNKCSLCYPCLPYSTNTLYEDFTLFHTQNSPVRMVLSNYNF